MSDGTLQSRGALASTLVNRCKELAARIAQLEADKVRLAAALWQCTQYATDDSAVASWRNAALTDVGDVLTEEEREWVEMYRGIHAHGGTAVDEALTCLVDIIDRIAPASERTR